jgi:hypothetical protein
MTVKHRLLLIGSLIALCGILLCSFIFPEPPNFFPLQQKPEETTQRIYDYYIILDEQDGHTLMYIPLIAHIGDEVLSEENKLYVITRVEENRAYARFVRDVKLQTR